MKDYFPGIYEDKHERAYWRRVGLLIFVALALALVLAPAMAASFSMRAENGDKITLYEDACHIKSEWFKKWKRANFHYQNKDYASCWSAQGAYVVVLDSEGSVTPVPMQAFSKDVEA